MTPEPAGGELRRLRISVGGAVQGVGYRPFVWRLAHDLGLAGWVSNGRAGLRIEAEGQSPDLDAFLAAMRAAHPANATPAGLTADWLPPAGFDGFTVRESDTGDPPTAAILPDLAVCADCLEEIRTPGARRFRYPFTTCTRCGPRFSILTAIPWDRARTTMAGYPLCPDCRREYDDPADRRFHAEALACPVCGPRLALQDARGAILARDDAALRGAVAALRQGRIVAVKGLGGFQLLVDARNDAALERLRAAKHRRQKPFAVMFGDAAALRTACRVTGAEAALLESARAPIVLVDRRPAGHGLSPLVAPGNPHVGAMLPTTPLHHLLLGDLGFPVVATSGNRAEEPIVTDEREAPVRLRGLADLFLAHNRPIARPVDDSVARMVAGGEMLLRRARGYAPLPLDAPTGRRVVLAVGGHQKNTVALAAYGRVTLSQHIGDLDTPAARDAADAAAGTLLGLWGAAPDAVVCDLHPDYASTRWAATRGSR